MPTAAAPITQPESRDTESILYRSFVGDFERVREDGDADDVYVYEFKASSEAEVPLWSRTFEKLDHSPTAVRMEWLASGNAPLLWMHDRRDQEGVILSAQIVNGNIVVRARMSPNSSDRVADIEAGVLKNVSIGYRIHKEEPRHEFDADGNIVRTTWFVTDWEPKEVSLVTIPADTTVGFGRAADDARKSRDRMREQTLEEKSPQEASTTRTMPESTTTTPAITVSESEAKEQRQAAVTDERNRSAGISAAAAAAKKNGFGDHTDTADEYIREGKSVAEFQRHILESAKRTPGVSTDELGLTKEEKKRYSVDNVIQGILNKDLEKRAAFELEVSRAHQDKIGKDQSRIAIPVDMLLRGYVPKDYRQRDVVTVGLSGAGQTDAAGNIVETSLLPELFVESLRAQSNILSKITLVPGLTGDVEIPIELLNPDFAWVGEEGSPAEGTYGLDKFKLEFKSVGAKIPFSRKARKQSTPAIENLLMASLRKGLAQALASAAINGAGGTAPRGILQTPGIGAVVTAGTLDRTKFRTLRKTLGDANVDVSRASGLCNASGEFLITDTPLDAGSGKFLGEIRNNGGVRTVIGDFETTNLVPANTMIFGDFSMYFMGMWGGLEIDRDTATGADSGSTYLRFWQDADGIAPRGADFAAITDLA